ncbi:hypothetical protein ACOMHN_004518 [Nucella lapillus]
MAICELCKGLIFLFTLGAVSGQIYLQRGGVGPSGQSFPTFIVTTPTRARYDTLTTFSISASGVTEPTAIVLRLRTGSASEVVLNETTLLFNNDEVRMWSVVIDSSRMLRHQQSVVQLWARHGNVDKVTTIPMNPLSGVIMIQTDKVIYTPRQTVMYRVIALDDDQRFAHWPVTVDIKNPDLIILERQHHHSLEAFKGRNFSLPRDATAGTWSITAYYDGSKVRTTKTINFDVQEYVLPTFKVEVTTDEKVIALSTNWLQVRTKAVYSYGRPVQGKVDLRLGIVGITTVSLFNTTYSDRLNGDGEWVFPVPVADMREHSAWFPDGSRLFVSVNVTEDGTSEVGRAVNMDTFFANPYYQINFDATKKFFRPGFPYNLELDVAAANGDPASQVNVYIIIEIKSESGEVLPDGFSSMFVLDDGGRLKEAVMLPVNAAAVHFMVYTVDPRAPDWAFNEVTIHKFVSTTDNYLHLQYAQDSSGLTIGYTPPSGVSQNISGGIGPQPLSAIDVTPGIITVLILSRGHLVHWFTVPRIQSGHSTYTLSRDVLVSVAPKARVVAYYYVSRSDTELVSDSLLIDTPDYCREEIQLNHASQMHRGVGQLHLLPKQSTDLDIMGGANMHVGLLAVDKAVYFLRDERSLTRNKLFSSLGEADEGRGIGDGRNTDKIFENAGLKYMKLTSAPEAQRPVVDRVLDINGLNFFPDVRRGNKLHWTEMQTIEEQIPLEMVRRYFPESWLFREVTLPGNGFTSEPITLPDSITTWIFTAVGVGEDGGVCMTQQPLELQTFKPFFSQVRLPYKAVRLEAVPINIGIYNYQNFDINVTVTVRGDLGLCFADSQHSQQRFVYRALLRAYRTNSETVRVIPLVAGNVKLMVDVWSNNRRERDIVEKTLYVVPEGRRVQKSITFPLDPSGEHSSHQAVNRRGVLRTETATVTNSISRLDHKQLTDILLFMPEEVVQGSERCQISACGDLMGDILSTSVMEGDNLFESSIMDAEEAIGNLAPAVHALQYLNESQLMTPDLFSKGQAYVAHGIARLLNYRKPDGSFSLTTDSPSATWLTALVLKTLCHAEQFTFVDHESLVMAGFAWLLNQVREDGKLTERDRRLARPSNEYDLMLSAETLIALQECADSRLLTEDDWLLMGRQEMLLGESLQAISSPLVMAKTAYALTLTAPLDETTQDAVRRLSNMKRTTIGDLHYWSVSSEDNDPPHRPFWYHSGSKASSIEATAYALLVFSKQAESAADYPDYGAEEEEGEGGEGEGGEGGADWHVNLDSIAGWLIQKRNSRGAFIGAMDTAAATQALSEYSSGKVGMSEVSLHCNVTTNPVNNYSHSFDFTALNAITPKSLSDVPVGRQLRVDTRGTGLGQMQVRVEYNVPVEANADCSYNVTITRRAVAFSPLRLDGDEVCRYCQMGCDDDDEGDNEERDDSSNRDRLRPMFGERVRGHGRAHIRSGGRQRRQMSSSRVAICIEVCIRSTEDMYADRTILDINMLSGFQPIAQDLERLYAKKENFSLSSLIYVPERASVEMKFNQVPHDRNTCVSFRATERRDVERRNPAIVTVRSHEDPEPTCVHTYDPVVSEVNLEVYCASNQPSNQGQCRCFSGLCGQCYSRSDEVSMNDIRNLTCGADYIYQVGPPSTAVSGDWVDMTVDIVAIKKNGTVAVDPRIQLVTPRSCTCPHRAGFSTPHFFFGSQVDVFVDRNNQRKKTYLVDQTTAFVSATSVYDRDPNRTANFISDALQTCRN